jgi:hypothetical protein
MPSTSSSAARLLTAKPPNLIQPAYDRYVRNHQERRLIEIWRFNRQLPRVRAGSRLRIQAGSPFMLHWTVDDWRRYTDTQSISTSLEVYYVNLPVPEDAGTIRFTSLWLNEDRWEGQEYQFEVQVWAHSHQERPGPAWKSHHARRPGKGHALTREIHMQMGMVAGQPLMRNGHECISSWFISDENRRAFKKCKSGKWQQFGEVPFRPILHFWAGPALTEKRHEKGSSC